MPDKKPGRNGAVKVTFTLPKAVGAETAALCGEFNEWSVTEHPLRRYKDGHFGITVALESGHRYRYRYLLDGQRWENDWDADAYAPNEFGSEDSLVEV